MWRCPGDVELSSGMCFVLVVRVLRCLHSLVCIIHPLIPRRQHQRFITLDLASSPHAKTPKVSIFFLSRIIREGREHEVNLKELHLSGARKRLPKLNRGTSSPGPEGQEVP